MKPCVSQATTLTSSFAEDIASFADAGCSAMEVWLTKLEEHLKSHSVSDTRKLLEDRQMELSAASYQGGLLLSQGDERKAHFDHFKRRLDLCQGFDIRTVVVAADFRAPVDSTGAQRAVVSLRQAAQWAAAFGVIIALEFRGQAPFCSNLATAAALIAACEEPNVGVALDAFHYYTGPSKLEDLDLLSKGRVAHVQVCDVAGVPRELATDADRIFPGEGDFQLVPLLARLAVMGYDGWVSLELFNPTLWQVKSTQVVELGLQAVSQLLAAAKDSTLKQGH